MDELTRDNFEKNLKSSFEVPIEGQDAIPLTLYSVTANQELNTEKQEQFTLIFTGPEDRPLDQASYQLTHKDMGELVIFLVPVSLKDGQYSYEAVFNRIKSD